MFSFEKILKNMYNPNSAQEAIIGNIIASLDDIVSGFSPVLANAVDCSLWCLTERIEPKKMGSRAITTSVPYARAIPSGVEGIFPVAFVAPPSSPSVTVAVRFSWICAITSSTTSAMAFCAAVRLWF
uniref:Uncharacterized protein n=1 Tax=Anopheles christyi TaxID=43041 RepID=A0A182KIB8_9DIPT